MKSTVRHSRVSKPPIKPKRGLSRPKKHLPFVLPQNSEQGGNPTSSPALQAQIPLQKPKGHIRLIDLIIRRNKNQHRNQHFFKYLRLLRKSLTKLETVLSKLADLAHEGNASRSSAQVRERFEAESQLRSQREVLMEHLREVLVPECYLSFSGLVADAQFANLGVVLMALLADVAVGEHGVGLPKHDGMLAIDGSMAEKVNTSHNEMRESYYNEMVAMSTRVTGEDQGEVVERIYSASPQPIKIGFEESFEDFDRGDITAEANVSKTNIVIDSGKKPELEVSRIDIQEKLVTKQKKTKKKKGALDDLFSGLL